MTWPACREWDAVVIGAGPCGSVAAGLLAQGGARVLLVDRKSMGRRKVCGGCWSAGGLELLEAIGARDRLDSIGGVKLRQFHLRAPMADLRLPMPEGLAVSREAADSALVQFAIDAGVCFCPNLRAVVGTEFDNGRYVHLECEEGNDSARVSVKTGLVLAADGLGHPSLRDLPEFRQPAVRGSHIGAGCTVADFPASLEPGAIHMAVGRQGYVGMVVVESGALNVAAALAPKRIQKEGLAGAAQAVLQQAGFPAIPALADAQWLGTPRLTRRESRVAGTRLFLLGDAAGYAEPFTGEGMTWAVMSACAVQLLARRAIREWRPELNWEWTAICRRMLGRRHLGCRALAGLLRMPLAVSGAARLMSLWPFLASHVVRFVSRTPGTEAVKRNLRNELQASGHGHCRARKSD